MAEVILAELHFATDYISDYGAYGYGFNFSDERPSFSLELGDKCIVHWDGSEYEVTVGDSSSIMPDTLYVGNGSGFGLPGNGEPFAIAWDATGETGVTMFSTVDTVGTTHLVAIYTAESSEFAPNDIILKRYSGEEKVFKGVDVVRLTHASNEYTVPYTFGEAVENIPITLDLGDGDQTVTAPEGTLVKSAVISKPVNLTPENIRSGKTIAGVTGEFVGESEPLIVGTSEGAVALDWSAGDQIITPVTDGKPFSPVTLEKPATLLPENIAEGIDIAGIIGTFAGGGGEIKISSGTFAGSANIVTVTHGLGVVPLMFGCVETYPLGTPTQYINYLHGGYVGFSSACMANNTVTRIGYCCTNYYGSSHNLGYRSYTTANQAIDGTSGVVHRANEQTLKVGTTASANSSSNTGGVRTNSNATYYWFAIGIA